VAGFFKRQNPLIYSQLLAVINLLENHYINPTHDAAEQVIFYRTTSAQS